MSTYASDTEWHLHTYDGHIDGTFIDVASDCLGVDVRLIIDGRSIYLTPTQASDYAAAINRCALETLARRADQ